MSTDDDRKDELLRVYRYSMSLSVDNDRYRNQASRRKEKLARLEEDLALEREENATYQQALTELELKTDALLKRVEQILGFQQEYKAARDKEVALLKERLIAFGIDEDPNDRPVVDLYMASNNDGSPSKCICCGGEKEEEVEYYSCGDCLEKIGNLENPDLWMRACADWDRGARDFPRPNLIQKLN